MPPVKKSKRLQTQVTMNNDLTVSNEGLGGQQSNVGQPIPSTSGTQEPPQAVVGQMQSMLERFETVFGACQQRIDRLEAQMSKSQGGVSQATTTTGNPATATPRNGIQAMSAGGPCAGSVLYNNALLPKFADDNTIHPVEFLARIEMYGEQQNMSECMQIALAVQNLEGVAGDWGAAFQGTWDGWAQFKASYLDMFWSEERQEEVKYQLHHDFYNKQVHGTMSAFFLSWMKRVKHLSPSISTQSFLRRVSHLFPANVENTLLAARLDTLEQTLKLLKNLDEAASRRKDRHVTKPKSSAPETSGSSQGVKEEQRKAAQEGGVDQREGPRPAEPYRGNRNWGNNDNRNWRSERDDRRENQPRNKNCVQQMTQGQEEPNTVEEQRSENYGESARDLH
jgi:hypothetical protein